MVEVAENPNSFPKSLANKFTNIRQATEDKELSFSNHITYNATGCADARPYTIRLFNTASEIFEKDRDLALTLYLQELFYLCARFGAFTDRSQNISDDARNSPIIDFKNFAVEGDKIAFVMKQTKSLKDLMNESNQGENHQEVDIEKMIQDVYTDIKYIDTRFATSSLEILPGSIYREF